MKLGLGTVQFGMNYGISNQEGQTSADSVAKILTLAANNNISVLDTAPAYGSSEQILGNTLLQTKHQFNIITKTPKIQKKKITLKDAEIIHHTFNQSLSLLHQSSLYGLLSHDTDNLLAVGGDYVYDKMVELKNRGLVKKIGASVYNEMQLNKLCEKYSFDLIQLPINVFDQRFLKNSCLTHLKNANIEIHARSAFLQGLLLISPDNIPPYFYSIKQHIIEYHDFLNKHQLTPTSAALGFALGIEEVDTVICGVTNDQQLQELLALKDPINSSYFKEFQLTEDCYINPSQWKLQ
jgi:aryl-alcohol dehydrogenase-like predicted oxidoreductase